MAFRKAIWPLCLTLSLAFGLAGDFAWAWPPLFGPEFTFTSERIIQSGFASVDREEARQRWVTKLTERCRETQECRVHGDRVEYRDGWWFRIGIDPKVLEIQAKPLTIADWEAIRPRVERDIFENARELGLVAHPEEGGGHVNIGLKSAFDDDARLFRNFVVDYLNHPGLDYAFEHGGGDPYNSFSLSTSRVARWKFKKFLRSFDRDGSEASVEKFAEGVNKAYRHTGNSLKYQALNLGHVYGKTPPEDQRVEVRPIRAQASLDDFLRYARIFESRLAHLKTKEGLVAFEDPGRIGTINRGLEQVYRYITESGLQWADYEDLIAPAWKGVPFRREASPRRCSQLFQKLFLFK